MGLKIYQHKKSDSFVHTSFGISGHTARRFIISKKVFIGIVCLPLYLSQGPAAEIWSVVHLPLTLMRILMSVRSVPNHLSKELQSVGGGRHVNSDGAAILRRSLKKIKMYVFKLTIIFRSPVFDKLRDQFVGYDFMTLSC